LETDFHIFQGLKPFKTTNQTGLWVKKVVFPRDMVKRVLSGEQKGTYIGNLVISNGENR
jgi:hypothetical protein